MLLTVNGSILLGLLIALELSVRLVQGPPAVGAEEEEPDLFRQVPYVWRQMSPNLNVAIEFPRRPAGSRQSRIETDEHGFRHRGDLSAPRDAGEIRLFMLGGSVVFRGRTNDTTICGRLESKISRAVGPGLRVRCIPAGITAAVSDQELALLVH